MALGPLHNTSQASWSISPKYLGGRERENEFQEGLSWVIEGPKLRGLLAPASPTQPSTLRTPHLSSWLCLGPAWTVNINLG